MKKKIMIGSLIAVAIISSILIYIFMIKGNKKETIIYEDGTIDQNIKIVDELNIEYGTIRHLSDYISIKGGKLKDVKIEYNDLGEKKVKFSYELDNVKYYKYLTFNIVDTTAPYVSVPSYKTIDINREITFIEDFFCGDNYDKNVERHLEGDFELGKVGTYYVKYVATDKSGNKTEKNMTLNIVEQITPSGNNNNNNEINYIDYSTLYNEYKNKNTKVGIDISRWQGDVDFDKLKENNVEFIMIRLGGQDGVDGDYYIDSKFEQNIKGALEKGFDVGVYFYSYAHTKEEAVKQAKYVIKNLKGYKITLPIVFDWECWNKFNQFGISFYDVTEVQKSFLDYVESKGYTASRYGSKHYLNNAWQETEHLTWLAHYTSNTDYEGDYFMWQRCDTGKVPGIYGAVDVDVLYLDKYNL